MAESEDFLATQVDNYDDEEEISRGDEVRI